MFLISSCRCLCAIHWSQVLSREWRCSWPVPTGDAPTTSEWSTILSCTKVQLILEVWWYVGNVGHKGYPSFLYALFFIVFRPPATKKLKGVYYCFHLVHLSVCLWIKSWLLFIFNIACFSHFISTHLINQVQRVCHMEIFFFKFQNFILFYFIFLGWVGGGGVYDLFCWIKIYIMGLWFHYEVISG